MTSHRFVTAATLGLTALVTSTGVVAAASVPEPAQGCTEIVALLDVGAAMGTAFAGEDAETLASLFESLPGLGAAAVQAAPPEVAEAVAVWTAPLEQFAVMLEGVDILDIDALVEAFSTLDATASDEVAPEVESWARQNCGWELTDVGYDGVSLEEAPEPPDCETLDAAAAAAAAGLDIDAADPDGTGDFNLGGFWTKSCSYGNGAMSLSTISFTTLEAAQQFYADNLDIAHGVVLADVDLGELPASTLVIRTGMTTEGTVPASTQELAVPAVASVSVSVFEASIPFSVSVLGEDLDPATVVAAAEAVYAALPAQAPPVAGNPASTEATATTAG